MWLASSHNFTGHQEAFFIFEKFPSLLYLLFFSWNFNSCASENRQGVAGVNVMVARKGKISQKPNLCLSLEMFPKKSSHRENSNSQTNYLYIKKAFIKDICLFFKALSIMKVFSLTIHDSTPPNRKTIITTKVLSFL